MRGRAASRVSRPSPGHIDPASAVFGPAHRAIRHNAPMSVTRIAWLATVLIALLTGFLLLLGGYNGYAALGLAVAIAAAINLL
jgi:hypothetical protein